MVKKSLRSEMYKLLCEGRAHKIRGYRKVIDDKYLLTDDERIYDRESNVLVPVKVDKAGYRRVILDKKDAKQSYSSFKIDSLKRHVYKTK